MILFTILKTQVLFLHAIDFLEIIRKLYCTLLHLFMKNLNFE